MERHPTAVAQKLRALKNGQGKVSFCFSVEEFILEQENRNAAQKTERGVRLLKRILKTKVEDSWRMEVIPTVELNEY